MTSPTAGDIGRVVVDPRFRARRVAVRKQAGRRRLRRLLVLSAVAATALATVVVFESPVLDVDEVAVTGVENLGTSTVTEAAAVDLGAPLLLTDLGAAERSIEQLPWIESAEVSRDLPGRVVVEVSERRAGAVVVAGGTRSLVDPSGAVLATGDPTTYPDHVPEGLLEIVVPDAMADQMPRPGDALPPQMRGAAALADRLRGDPAGSVDVVRLGPTLSFQLAGGGTVELGDDSDLDLKVEAFRTVFARVDRTCLDTIDLRVATHPVVTREQRC